MKYFLEIIVPVSIKGTFTYQCTEEDFKLASIGSRVIVQFGKSRYYTGIVFQKHHNTPEVLKPKFIEQVLDERPVVNEKQLKLWQWIASYYMSNLGEVYRNGVPSALKLESETKIVRHPEYNDEIVDELGDDEFQICEALNFQDALSIKEISEIINKSNPMKLIKSLVEKKLLIPVEEIKNKYKVKSEKFYRLNPDLDKNDRLKDVFDELSRAQKQKEILLYFLSLKAQGKQKVSHKELKENSAYSASALKGLADKGILEEVIEEVDRIKSFGEITKHEIVYSEAQSEAITKINNSFKNQAVCLFHGVTSSGKTEIYIDLIRGVLKKNKQVLFLVPEIALTTQLINRLVHYFGEEVGVYHSRFNNNERVEIWNAVNDDLGKYRLILGPRSSLFLPFSNLGLIIVDEEHESSYKQQDPAPRFHARDMAIVLAKIHKAKVILGTATPSLDSMYNVQKGKYAYVSLKERFSGIKMPHIEIADIKEDNKKKRMHQHFSERLFLQIEDTLRARKQVILFQNRRGYSPVVECETCGTSVECPNCDVTLTYHQRSNQLRCHYCGYSLPMIKSCNSCGSPRLNTKGLGTQQIEKECEDLFPGARIARLDLDTSRTKYAYQDIISKFESREVDILIGTQMITKGLDFENVALVGVLNSDTILNFPDFRAHEKAFQLLSQVSGRAGRKGEQGKVIIQSYNPFHTIIQQVSSYSFDKMYREQLQERKNYHYPPFYRIINLTIKHRDKTKVDTASAHLVLSIKQIKNVIVLGPEYPSIARIKNLYHKNIMIKILNNADLNPTKKYLNHILDNFQQIQAYRSIRISVDVDPY